MESDGDDAEAHPWVGHPCSLQVTPGHDGDAEKYNARNNKLQKPKYSNSLSTHLFVKNGMLCLRIDVKIMGQK